MLKINIPGREELTLSHLVLDYNGTIAEDGEIIEELLLKLKEQYTIVIVTHNLFQARRIADDCIFMLNGQLWEQNTVEELFNNPQKQETKDYLQGAYA